MNILTPAILFELERIAHKYRELYEKIFALTDFGFFTVIYEKDPSYIICLCCQKQSNINIHIFIKKDKEVEYIESFKRVDMSAVIENTAVISSIFNIMELQNKKLTFKIITKNNTQSFLEGRRV